MRRKRTKREKQDAVSERRHKHELRKRRKQRGQSSVTQAGDYSPNVLAVFGVNRKKKEKKK